MHETLKVNIFIFVKINLFMKKYSYVSQPTTFGLVKIWCNKFHIFICWPGHGSSTFPDVSQRQSFHGFKVQAPFWVLMGFKYY